MPVFLGFVLCVYRALTMIATWSLLRMYHVLTMIATCSLLFMYHVLTTIATWSLLLMYHLRVPCLDHDSYMVSPVQTQF